MADDGGVKMLWEEQVALYMLISTCACVVLELVAHLFKDFAILARLRARPVSSVHMAAVLLALQRLFALFFYVAAFSLSTHPASCVLSFRATMVATALVSASSLLSCVVKTASALESSFVGLVCIAVAATVSVASSLIWCAVLGSVRVTQLAETPPPSSFYVGSCQLDTSGTAWVSAQLAASIALLVVLVWLETISFLTWLEGLQHPSLVPSDVILRYLTHVSHLATFMAFDIFSLVWLLTHQHSGPMFMTAVYIHVFACLVYGPRQLERFHDATNEERARAAEVFERDRESWSIKTHRPATVAPL